MAKRELPILPVNVINGPVDIIIKKPRLRYDCSKCPAYCCSYDWIVVTRRDVQRLARRFDLTYEEAEARFTKFVAEYGQRVLRHRRDDIYKSTCRFLHPTKRMCTVYEHRPAICRTFPEERNCGYYDFLTWERTHQDDETYIPLQG